MSISMGFESRLAKIMVTLLGLSHYIGTLRLYWFASIVF